MNDHRTSTSSPKITVAVPSFNQGQHLAATLESILAQGVDVEICLADGGSTDNTAQVIDTFRDRLHWIRSGPDGGQSSAINAAVSQGSADLVCWLNSDDLYLPGALKILMAALDKNPRSPFVYGRTRLVDEHDQPAGAYPTQAFSTDAFARRCFISQPSTLMRREAWENVGGLDESMHMAMDYDLWWRLYRDSGEPVFVDQDVAQDRRHPASKTSTRRREHYQEAFELLRRHYGRVPWIWYAKWPWSVWYKERQHPQKSG